MDALGPEPADTLMDYLPPVGWADVATKHDLDALSVATKRDLDALSVATKRDLDALSVATKRDLDSLATTIELTEQRLMTHVHHELRLQFYWTVTVMVMLFGAFAALIKLT